MTSGTGTDRAAASVRAAAEKVDAVTTAVVQAAVAKVTKVKVSVIVAVHNPGDDINELLTSIDNQSMPPEEFEVIFADDDSTDGSRERLVEWAATRPHVRVLHNTPNSGWPGRPRNLGIDQATGQFLFFADNDDKLAPQALEWMYEYAIANGADVVIPKLLGIGPGRSVPRQLFRRNIPDAKLGTDPILSILTPHKLVRTSMVRKHGIRFPEGRIRLEDHFFVVSCYFAARRISVLADKVCYFWMRRVAAGENASFAAYDPVMYYGSVERVLEVVERHTEPGELRDKLYAHWYESKMLSRLRGGSLVMKVPEYREPLLRELRRLSDRFGLGRAQWPWLGAGGRLRSHLVEHGTLEQIEIVGAAERGITQECRIDELAWTEEGRLRVTLQARLVYHDGRPIRLVHEDGAVFWDTAHLVPQLDLPRIDISDLYPRIRQHVMATDRRTEDIDFVPECTSGAVHGEELGTRAECIIDPATIVEFTDGGTVVDLRSRVAAAGWGSERRIPVADHRALPEARVVGGVRAKPYLTRGHGNLSIALDPTDPPDATDSPEHDRQPAARFPARVVRWGRDRAPARVRAFAGRARRAVRRRLGR